MKRRNFIIGAVGITAISISGTYFYISRDIDYDPLLAEPQSLFLIWDNETISTIGKQYTGQITDENTEQALAKKLVADMTGSGDALIQNLEKKIKLDFEEDNIVLVDGWMLSKTEVRQCALFSTLQPKK